MPWFINPITPILNISTPKNPSSEKQSQTDNENNQFILNKKNEVEDLKKFLEKKIQKANEKWNSSKQEIEDKFQKNWNTNINNKRVTDFDNWFSQLNNWLDQETKKIYEEQQSLEVFRWTENDIKGKINTEINSLISLIDQINKAKASWTQEKENIKKDFTKFENDVINKTNLEDKLSKIKEWLSKQAKQIYETNQEISIFSWTQENIEKKIQSEINYNKLVAEIETLKQSLNNWRNNFYSQIEDVWPAKKQQNNDYQVTTLLPPSLVERINDAKKILDIEPDKNISSSIHQDINKEKDKKRNQIIEDVKQQLSNLSEKVKSNFKTNFLENFPNPYKNVKEGFEASFLKEIDSYDLNVNTLDTAKNSVNSKINSFVQYANNEFDQAIKNWDTKIKQINSVLPENNYQSLDDLSNDLKNINDTLVQKIERELKEEFKKLIVKVNNKKEQLASELKTKIFNDMQIKKTSEIQEEAKKATDLLYQIRRDELNKIFQSEKDQKPTKELIENIKDLKNKQKQMFNNNIYIWCNNGSNWTSVFKHVGTLGFCSGYTVANNVDAWQQGLNLDWDGLYNFLIATGIVTIGAGMIAAAPAIPAALNTWLASSSAAISIATGTLSLAF